MLVRWLFGISAALIVATALRPSGRAFKALSDGVAVIKKTGAPQKFMAAMRGEQHESGYFEALFPADADPETRRRMEELAAETGAPRRLVDERIRHQADDVDRFN